MDQDMSSNSMIGSIIRGFALIELLVSMAAVGVVALAIVYFFARR